MQGISIPTTQTIAIAGTNDPAIIPMGLGNSIAIPSNGGFEFVASGPKAGQFLWTRRRATFDIRHEAGFKSALGQILIFPGFLINGESGAASQPVSYGFDVDDASFRPSGGFGYAQMNPGDSIGFWVSNSTDATDVEVKTPQLFVRQI